MEDYSAQELIREQQYRNKLKDMSMNIEKNMEMYKQQVLQNEMKKRLNQSMKGT